MKMRWRIHTSFNIFTYHQPQPALADRLRQQFDKALVEHARRDVAEDDRVIFRELIERAGLASA